MTPRFAIQRSTDAWFWLGGRQWISAGDQALLFDTEVEAELAFMVEGTPVPMREWNVVPVVATEAALKDRS